jgi:hypothetical protein
VESTFFRDPHTAIERGGALAPIVAELQERQTERDGILASIAAEAVGQLQIDRRTVEKKMLAQWSTGGSC